MMGLFGISRELQFRVCGCGDPRASPSMAGKGEYFYREEKETWEDYLVNKESSGFSLVESLWGRKGGCLLFGLYYRHRAQERPLLVSQLYLIEVSVHSFFTS